MKRRDKIFLLSAIFVVALIPLTVAIGLSRPQAYYVASGSMEPSLPFNTRLVIARRPYRNMNEVRRGDIIVYQHFDKNTGKSMDLIKRVIGLPGDVVSLKNTNIWINGKQLPHKLKNQTGAISIFEENNSGAFYDIQHDTTSPSPTFSATVPRNEVFCLGDNRDNSLDSRHIGCVPFSAIIGKKLSW
jgi:signal peptidase I